jgi:aerobic carbon-monoxide dehydrogenase medium subunit
MKAPPFDYAAPTSLEEAVARKAADGDEALLLAGGQSLIPLMALRLATPATIVDLNRVEELAYVRPEKGLLRIGAMARHRDVEDSADVLARAPVLADAVPSIGHRAIRNRGTVGGSVAHADPAAEWPALALALDATIEVAGPSGSRDVGAGDFFLAPFVNALASDEMVREIRFAPPDAPGTGSAFVKHSRRHGDFAIAGVAVVVRIGAEERVSAARIVLLGVGGTPVRVTDAERDLEGGPLTDGAIAAAAEACRRILEPPTDVHASGRYRRHLSGVLAGRALRVARDRATAA